MARDYGFTINTHVNKMYFEAHGFRHKRVRYDRVVLVVPEHQSLSSPSSSSLSTSRTDTITHLCSKAKPQSIELLGTEPFGEGGRIWPSDHFGLVAHFGICDELIHVESYQVDNVNDVAGADEMIGGT